MKILLVILHAESTRGGAELYTVTLFHKLLAAGHDVSLAAATFEKSIPPDQRVPLRHSGFGRYTKYKRFLASLRSHTRQAKYDVIHAMLPAPCDVYHPHAGLELANYRAASFWRRMFNERQWAFARFERAMMTSARPPIMLCLSNRARDQATAIYPAAVARMTTLYSGVDDARFPAPATPSPPLSETGKPPVCLFVGQDFARKGLDIAIHAIADHPSAILRVIGDDDPAPYRAIAERRSVADRVEFVGGTRDVARHLAEASALLLPARREPFGMVAVEAMLCGVPPIVSDVTGVSEILHDGIDGKIIATNNPETWAAAIHDVLKHHAQYAAACAARRSELSYDSHLARLIEIYERVVAEKSR